jgi:ABC-type uncharacterized transport system substrate-binding protein
VKLVLVYYQEEDGLITGEVIDKMKANFQKENWRFAGLFIDKINEYDRLMDVITEELKKVDVIYLYSKNNICDEFYWNFLLQTAKVENVLIKVYLKP